MKILSKVTIPVLLLFLGGCAHYAGYYSDYSGHGTYSLGVNSYTPYYSHNSYVRKPYNNYRGHYYGYKQHYRRKSNFFVNNQYPRHRYNIRGRYHSRRYFPESQRRHNRHIGDFVYRRSEAGDRHRRRNRGYKQHDKEHHK